MAHSAPTPFAASYRLARERFLENVDALRPVADVAVHTHPIAARGPDGETLAIDVALVGAPDPRRILVLSSGMHGVEGHLGSAIQVGALADWRASLALPTDTAIALVHAINPYGYAWHRRVNESNVDLNRNFLAHFDARDCSADYVALHDALNPEDLDPVRESARIERIATFVETQGWRAFQQVVIEGQYMFERGMQFGGARLEASSAHVLALADEHMRRAEHVLWLDFHTGLGERGALEVISDEAAPERSRAFAQRVFGDVVKSPILDTSVTTPLKGVADRALVERLGGARLTFVVAEFGTYPGEYVFRAMRRDNWLHAHGDPSDALGRRISAELLEAFRPADPVWQTQVRARGMELVHEGLAGLGRASSRSDA